MIQINEKLRIRKVDNMNLELEEYRCIVDKKTKAERYDWMWVGYYGDLRSALGGAIKRCAMSLADEDLQGIKAVMERLDKIESDVKNAISKI